MIKCEIKCVIGERIKTERLKLSMTKVGLYNKIFLEGTADSDSSKNKLVSEWESGKTKLDYEKILRMCDLFKCSSDYLLGLDECTNKTTQFISELTGLNENTINILIDLKSNTLDGKENKCANGINIIFNDDYTSFRLFGCIYEFEKHLKSTEENKLLKSTINVQNMSTEEEFNFANENDEEYRSVSYQYIEEYKNRTDLIRYKTSQCFEDILSKLQKEYYQIIKIK